MWLRNAKVVLPDRIIECGAVCVEDQRISEIADGADPGRGLDLGGRTLLPGLVDVHGDMLEREIEPRPKTAFPDELALYEVDKRLASNGITTAFAAIAFSWEDFGDLRSEHRAREIMSTITAHRGALLCDHYVHARFAVTNPEAGKVLQNLLEAAEVHLVSLMDHTPGQGQFRDIETYVRFAQKWRKQTAGEDLSDSELRDYVKEMQARPKAWDVVGELSRIAHERGVPLASHDDDSPEKVEFLSQFGLAISEFPVTLDAAEEAKRRGIHVAMGAPNAFRGISSTSGNLSATEAIEAGALDVLAADYYPAAMLHAPFAVAARGTMPLAEAVKLVSANPAEAVGLKDRGRIEVGCQADFAIVEEADRPRVRGALRAGRPIYWDGALPHMLADSRQAMDVMD